jgi:hypothetical protein
MVDYVLVSDVSDNGMLYYYCGYFEGGIPINTLKYEKAMKIPYQKEAQEICDRVNAMKNCPFKYHVEEHMYA